MDLTYPQHFQTGVKVKVHPKLTLNAISAGLTSELGINSSFNLTGSWNFWVQQNFVSRLRYLDKFGFEPGNDRYLELGIRYGIPCDDPVRFTGRDRVKELCHS